MTDAQRIGEAMASLRDQGAPADARWYHHPAFGMVRVERDGLVFLDEEDEPVTDEAEIARRTAAWKEVWIGEVCR